MRDKKLVLTLITAAVAGLIGLLAVPSLDAPRKAAALDPLPSDAKAEGERSDDSERVRSPQVASTPERPSARLSAAPSSLDAWSVAGHVRLGTNGSLPDAPLLVSMYAGFEAKGEPLAQARIRADANGDFEWSTHEPAEPVTIRVIPELEGHKTGASTAVATPGDPPPRDLRPYAYGFDTSVTGRVLDGEGQGVAGARVSSPLSEARTDAEGRYSLPMDSGHRRPYFHALAEGFACERFAVGALQPGEVRGPDVTLRRELAVCGRVVDAEGAPIAGATVCSYPFDQLRTTTAADGRFRLGGLDPAAQRTSISAKFDGLAGSRQSIEPQTLQPESELEFVLTPGARLSGRVVTEAGRPVPNAAVCFNGYPNTQGPRTTRSDEHGAFELSGISKGANDLWARRSGWAAGRIRLTIEEADAQISGLEIVLTRGFSLTGTVLDEAGHPIAGAEVRPEPLGPGGYVGDSARSDAQGRFALQDMRHEEFEVRASAAGFASAAQWVRAGTDVTLRPERAGGLAGLVVDGATGAPIDSFVVRALPITPVPGDKGRAKLRGPWTLDGISFAGTDGLWDSGRETLTVGSVIGVEISAAGYAPSTVERVVVSATPKPEDLRVELHAGATLRGIVTDATSGLPVRDARVRRFTEGDPHATRRYLPDEERAARTDADGRFQLERVPEGAMFLMVDQSGLPLHIDGPFEVAATGMTTERLIALTAGARVLGRFLDGDGHPFAHQSVTLVPLEVPDEREWRTTETDADGAFAFEGLSPGPHHLRGRVTRAGASAAVGAAWLELVEVEEGQTMEFDLRARGQATLLGTVEYEGELPDEVTVTLRPEQAHATWAQRIVEAGLHDGSFSAPGLDAGEWSVNVFLEVDGELVTGGAKVQIPETGTAEVHVVLRKLQR